MERRRIASWLVPSIGEILFLCILLRTLYLGGQLLNDGDTGWHIAAGNDILSSGRIPRVDPFSHTVQGATWIAHEWLSEVIFSLTHKFMGLNGVVLLTASVISLTMYFLYRFMVYRKVNPLLAALLTILAASASAGHWLARPHIFSFIMTLAFIVILETYQREGVNRLAWLPVLMVLWVNLYGGFMLGIILIAIYACGNLIQSLTSPEGRERSGKNFKFLTLALLATIIAALINPRGIAMLYFPIQEVSGAFNENIMDWASPDFHAERSFELLLLGILAIFALSRRKLDFNEGICALMFAHMSLSSRRFIPLFAIAVTPMAAVRAGEVLKGISNNPGSLRIVKKLRAALESIACNITAIEVRSGRGLWIILPVIFLFVICMNGGRIAGAKVFDYQFSDKKFPVGAFEFAMKNGVNGNMFNSFAWGGYILYRGYPRYKVFIDGRTEVYGTELMKEYGKVEWAAPGFEDILDKYKVDWVIDGAGSPLIRALTIQGGWKAVYADKTAEILLRDTPGNRGLIDKFAAGGR